MFLNCHTCEIPVFWRAVLYADLFLLWPQVLTLTLENHVCEKPPSLGFSLFSSEQDRDASLHTICLSPSNHLSWNIQEKTEQCFHPRYVPRRYQLTILPHFITGCYV